MMKMPITFCFLASFTGITVYSLYASSSVRDAAWRLASTTFPFSHLVVIGHFENIYFNIALLMVGGVIQYGGIGWCFDKVLEVLLG